ncbi:uncharacterized protein LOC105778800 [Gossypium raimondii]|uniref:uncharacterized protein LOC105778800 n=1 Tax=Gossypium raimondii TaxID=29730 RepID=UPI00227D2AB4|nr:uncharacterized protein LOC105778800 [Gossypium raimondii]
MRPLTFRQTPITAELAEARSPGKSPPFLFYFIFQTLESPSSSDLNRMDEDFGGAPAKVVAGVRRPYSDACEERLEGVVAHAREEAWLCCGTGVYCLRFISQLG